MAGLRPVRPRRWRPAPGRIAAKQRTRLTGGGRLAAMSNPAATLMDVDAFLAWAEGRGGRWELHDGKPVMMAPERAVHALTKFAVQKSWTPPFCAPVCLAACFRTA